MIRSKNNKGKYILGKTSKNWMFEAKKLLEIEELSFFYNFDSNLRVLGISNEILFLYIIQRLKRIILNSAKMFQTKEYLLLLQFCYFWI